MTYVLGLDLGTSSLKGLLFNEEGRLISQASSDYGLSHPQKGYSEQDPALWIRAAKTVMHSLIEQVPKMREELAAISFSGQMHSLVLLDEKEEVVRPAILWNDVRTTRQCHEIMKSAGELLLKVTKNKALEGFTLPKILWLQENEPENWKRVRHMMLPKDYLAHWLTGEYSTDYSDAAGTLLLDVEGHKWSSEILQQFNISQELLPKLHESAELVGEMTPRCQEEFGLKRPVHIYAGGADNACAALGSGIIHEGVGMASIGTSGVFLSYEKSAVDYQGKLHVFNHVIPNAYYSMGVTLAAGNSLNWFRDTFAPETSFEDLLADVHKVAPGAEGLLFTPYIVGERTPYTDAVIRGSFIGIDTQHELKHFKGAVLEGITFSLKDSQNIMEELAQRKFSKIVSVGGGAKNPDWLQMQADVFDSEIQTLVTEQGPGVGAAMLAAVGEGLFADFEECVASFVQNREVYRPVEENVAMYQRVYAVYRQVYGATKGICEEISRL